MEKSTDRSPDAKPSDEAICIVVGRVSSTRLQVSQNGNYDQRYGNVLKTKYVFFLRSPTDDLDFSPDWVHALANIEHVQLAIASGTNCKNLIVSYGVQRFLRFSANMYQARVSLLC